MDAALLFVWALSPLTRLHPILSRAAKTYIRERIRVKKRRGKGISYSNRI